MDTRRFLEPREDCWNCDVEGLADWNVVANIRNKEDRATKAPGCAFSRERIPTTRRKS